MTARHSVSLNLIEKEVQALGLLYRRNPSASHSFDFSKVRDASFFDYWATYYRENWYDYQLKDYSLLSFNENNSGDETFVYLGCPVNCLVTEEEYYQNDVLYRSGVSYEDYLLGCPKRDNAPYLRYDKAPGQYNTGLHPANHLHFGYSQNNRVGCLYHLDLIAFVAIVLRQFYPDCWSTVMTNGKTYPYLNGYKSKLEMIGEEHYHGFDNSHDLYLK